MKALLRSSLATLVGCWMLSLTSVALAEGEACYNDDDCPGGGNVCGGDVCNWNKMAAVPQGEKIFYCNPAGTGSKGSDGWCTETSDCKCKGEGATCVAPYCTFTKPSDAPGGVGGSSAGGSAAGGGAGAGSSAGGSAAGGSAAGGGAAGSGTTAGTSATAGSGTTPQPAPKDEGGCSVSTPSSSGGGALLALGAAGLGFALARRRR